MGRRLDPLHPEDARRLTAYAWPGNVRELQNVIERAIILSHGSRIELHRAMPDAANAAPEMALEDSNDDAASRIFTAGEIEAIERANIERALAACGGKISGDSGAAQRLGLAASTLSSRMKALKIQRKG
jgi:DNA-binding NtrC family response regulator